MVFKIHYFPVRGRAEIFRVILSLGGVPWEDVLIKKEEWPEAKASGKYLFGQIPALELDDGTILCQSQAIARFLAKETKLYPEDSVEAARVDAMADSACDILDGFIQIFHMEGATEEEKRAARDKFQQGNVNKNLGVWERLLSEGAQFLANGKLSLADAWAYLILEIFGDFAADMLEPFPSLKPYMQRIQELPGLREYVSSESRLPVR